MYYRMLLKSELTRAIFLILGLSYLGACAKPSSSKLSKDTQAYIEESLEENEKARLIVVFNERAPSYQKTALSRFEKLALLGQDKHDFLYATKNKGLTQKTDFLSLPLMSIELTSNEALEALKKDGRILSIHEDKKLKRSLSRSLDIIDQPRVKSAGFVASNTSVAIIDSGLDHTKAAFGSCVEPGVPANCRVAFNGEFADQDGQLDDSYAHGTHVAAIVAGVAPETKLLGLDVFEGDFAYTSSILAAIDWVIRNKDTYKIAAMNLSLGGGRYYSSCDSDPMALALSQARNQGILAAVASGNSGWSNSVAAPACASAAISVGASYTADLGTIGWGICQDSSTGVDQIACFSNSYANLDIVAPGVDVTAAGKNMSGTSQATPHVAGALAILKSAYPDESVDEIESRLLAKAPKITDRRNNKSFPFLNLIKSTDDCAIAISKNQVALSAKSTSFELTLTTASSCEWSLENTSTWLSSEISQASGSKTLTFNVEENFATKRSTNLRFTLKLSGKTKEVVVTQNEDQTAPTGSLTINNADAYTRSRLVALKIEGMDESGLASMCLSEEDTCSQWQAFSAETNFELSVNDGNKTLGLWLRDGLGNEAKVDEANIILDMYAPSGESIVLSSKTENSLSLSWQAFSDETSGVETYILAYSLEPIESCQSQVIYEGDSLSYTHNSLSAATNYFYALCARDKAGNLSEASLLQATTTALNDEITESGSISINQGDEYTRSRSVILSIDAPSGASSMCISRQAEFCENWESLQSEKAYLLENIQGEQSVYVRFKNDLGRISSEASMDRIIFDSIAPKISRISKKTGRKAIKFFWKDAIEQGSGIAGYKLVYRIGRKLPAKACSDSTSATILGANEAIARGLSSQTLYSFRLCAVDKAGNITPGKAWRAKTR